MTDTKQTEGFDKETFMALANERSKSFSDAKNNSNSWMPPPSDGDEDYLCELMDVRLGTFKDHKTGVQVTYFRPTFRIADERLDGETSLMNKRFGQMFSMQESRMGIVSRVIASLYGDKDCPDDLGLALVGLPDLKGTFYGVAVRAPRDPKYPPNVFVNKCLGAGAES